MRVYTAGRGRRRVPWKRVALITLGVVLALLVSLGAAVAWWANGLYAEIAQVDDDVRQATERLDPVPPLPDQPAVALVVGSDKRAAEARGEPARSDTLMLVRIDPRTRYISLLSLPRDLRVDIPGIGSNKINAAFSAGGPKLAVQTVKNLTGLDINYLISVDFKGFVDLVNSFGGVYIPVDQDYYHSNAETIEKYDEIDIDPGYQLLNGTDALDFSRYRHTDSDFYRNARQQLFLRSFESRVSGELGGIGVSDLPTIKDVFETIAGNVQVTGSGGPPRVSTIIDYARLAYTIKGRVVSVKLDAVDAGDATFSYVEASPEAIQKAVYQFQHPEKIRRPTNELPKKPAKKKEKKKGFQPAMDPAGVSVVTLNGNGRSGSAAAAQVALAPWGYALTVGGNAPAWTYEQTLVYYRPGFRAAARDLVAITGHGRAAPIPANFTAAADVVLVVGADFTGRLKIKPPSPEPPAAGGPPDIRLDDEVYRDAFAQAERRVHFPVLYPTAVQTGSEFRPWTYESAVRTYRIEAAPGDGHNSLYAVYKLGSIAGAYWGIQETRFTDAPLLESPDAVRRLDGREYRFFFNGRHIHTIAFVRGDVAYWITNTLRDDLTNGAMVALARSLRPVS
jgi:LCP family protein required for cell wall assembly